MYRTNVDLAIDSDKITLDTEVTAELTDKRVFDMSNSSMFDGCFNTAYEIATVILFQLVTRSYVKSLVIPVNNCSIDHQANHQTTKMKSSPTRQRSEVATTASFVLRLYLLYGTTSLFAPLEDLAIRAHESHGPYLEHWHVPHPHRAELRLSEERSKLPVYPGPQFCEPNAMLLNTFRQGSRAYRFVFGGSHTAEKNGNWCTKLSSAAPRTSQHRKDIRAAVSAVNTTETELGGEEAREAREDESQGEGGGKGRCLGGTRVFVVFYLPLIGVIPSFDLVSCHPLLAPLREFRAPRALVFHVSFASSRMPRSRPLPCFTPTTTPLTSKTPSSTLVNHSHAVETKVTKTGRLNKIVYKEVGSWAANDDVFTLQQWQIITKGGLETHGAPVFCWSAMSLRWRVHWKTKAEKLKEDIAHDCFRTLGKCLIWHIDPGCQLGNHSSMLALLEGVPLEVELLSLVRFPAH
ncbi:hypothetical protein C8Q76DRAFT_689275 [Earliella scabrosa]|nr:hypothetical protein C8Q76DRAFT_689275 [Earliella scabrosa]